MLIATKPFEALSKDLLQWIKFITPNLAEMQHIYAFFKKKESQRKEEPVIPAQEDTLNKLVEYAPYLLDNVETIIVTMSETGIALLSRREKDSKYFSKGGRFIPLSGQDSNAGYFFDTGHSRLTDQEIRNVSGGGDSFNAGFITAMLNGHNSSYCVAYGMAASLCALRAPSAVPERYKIANKTLEGPIPAGKMLF